MLLLNTFPYTGQPVNSFGSLFQDLTVFMLVQPFTDDSPHQVRKAAVFSLSYLHQDLVLLLFQLDLGAIFG
jgi:hypothetical protein